MVALHAFFTWNRRVGDLRGVPDLQLEVVEVGNGAKGLGEAVTAASMVTKHTPVLEPCDGVFDACTSAAMAPPARISRDASPSVARSHELGDASIAAIGEYTAMANARLLDRRAAVAHGVISVARTTRRGSSRRRFDVRSTS